MPPPTKRAVARSPSATRSVAAIEVSREQKSVRERVSEAFKQARNSKGWTLEELASHIIKIAQGEIENISTAHLSRIENKLARPTDEQLYWINQALGRPLGPMFDQNTEPYGWYLIKQGKILQRLQDLENGVREIKRTDEARSHAALIKTGEYRYVPLQPDGSRDLVAFRNGPELDETKLQNTVSVMEIAPIDPERLRTLLDHHDGQEALYCLEGEIEFWCQPHLRDEIIDIKMKSGDFVRFESQMRHAFRSVGPGTAKALHIYSNAAPPLRSVIELKEK